MVRQDGYDLATGRRRVKQLGTFATKRAALAYQKALVEGGVGTAAGTFAEFLEAWLRSKEGRVATATFDSVRLGRAPPHRPAARRRAPRGPHR